MAKETKTQWHPAFCSAMALTLIEDKDNLHFTREYNLSSKPLQIDLLIIEKKDGVRLHSDIGQIFHRHNLIEYKSPDDKLNIDTYYKVMGYGCLYKSSSGRTVDEISDKDISLTILRHERPDKLMKILKAGGTHIENKYPGIYYLTGKNPFDTQIVVSKELPETGYIWLKALTRHLAGQEARHLITSTSLYPVDTQEGREADSVMQVAMSTNRSVFDEIKKEDPIMCDALRELMRPEMEEEMKAALDKNTRDVTQQVTTAEEKKYAEKDRSRINILFNSGTSLDNLYDAFGKSAVDAALANY